MRSVHADKMIRFGARDSTRERHLSQQSLSASTSFFRRRATSRRRSHKLRRGPRRRPRRSRRCSASPARARPTRWRTSSRASAGRRWCWRRTRRSRRSSTRSSASSSRRTRSSTSSRTTTTTSRKPTSRRATSTSRRTRSINEHIEQMRLSATKSLLERRDVVIVATVSAIYGIGDPSEYHGMILHLRQGEKMAQRDVLRAAGGDAVRAQRARLPPRHLPRARRRDRRASRPSTPSTRSGSR